MVVELSTWTVGNLQKAMAPNKNDSFSGRDEASQVPSPAMLAPLAALNWKQEPENKTKQTGGFDERVH